MCHQIWNASSSRTRCRRDLRFAAFCSPKLCKGYEYFKFWKMSMWAPRRLKNWFYKTLSKSRIGWSRKLNIHNSVYISDFGKWARKRAEGRKTDFSWPSLTREPFDLESWTLSHFIALSFAKVMNISNFKKWAREPQEDRKTDFTWPSLTREPFDLESSTLSHFIAHTIPNSVYNSDMKYCVSARAEGPLCAVFT